MLRRNRASHGSHATRRQSAGNRCSYILPPEKGRSRSREGRSPMPTRERTLTCGTRRERPANSSACRRRRSAIYSYSGRCTHCAPVRGEASLSEYVPLRSGRSRLAREPVASERAKHGPTPKRRTSWPAQVPGGACAATARRPRPKRNRTGKPVRTLSAAEAAPSSCQHRGAHCGDPASRLVAACVVCAG